MGELLEIITPLHRSTRRDYLARMVDDKVQCSTVARQYGPEYWDGARRYGYGGYRYDGRYAQVAEALALHYRLPADARILDLGCGKGFLLYELSLRLPQATLTGIDISDHALETAHPGVRDRLVKGRAEGPLPFKNKEFDLVLSVGTLHNLTLPDIERALREIERVGKHSYVLMESYRNVAELFNLQCWALTCESFLRPEEWQWLFKRCEYTGDHELIYFE